MKGKPYIRFNVEFPDSGSLSPQQCKETIMHDVNMEEEKRQHQQQEAYDEDEEPSTSWVQWVLMENSRMLIVGYLRGLAGFEVKLSNECWSQRSYKYRINKLWMGY